MLNLTIESYLKRNAYSYIRFSSAAQSAGDSFRRQMSRTAEFCQRHNLQLNETRYEDLGVSGWTGKNMERGALGDFLHAVKADKIPKGSVLVVENFDRFSRLKPRVAYNKLAEIIENGVDVVTLEDGKFHTKETLDDFATLVSSLAVMQRANEESNRKSSVLGAAWEEKRQNALKRGEVMTGHCPAWLRLKADRSGFEPIPERVKILHRIIRLMKEGKGKREISRMLDAEKVPTWSRAKHWYENYIFTITKSRALLGELQLCQRKKQKGEVVKNYYPAVIDERTWAAIQPVKRQFTAGPQSDVINLFPGLLHDGYHPKFRMKLFVQSKTQKYMYLQSDYRRVDPWYSQKGKKKLKERPLSAETLHYKEFEEHFLKHFEEFDFQDAMPQPARAESSRLALVEAEKNENDKALANLVKAVEKGDDSVVLSARIKEREATARRLAKELAGELQRQRAERFAVDSFEAEQQRITELLEASTREARLALRALFHRIIERIDVFTSGLLEGVGHIPEDLKTTVYPDRVGMMCYCIKMVGSNQIWFWEDGCTEWRKWDAEMPSDSDTLN